MPHSMSIAIVTAEPHKTSHQDGGTDEINVAALSGLLADPQPSTWPLVSGKPSTFPPDAHKTSHQDGGTDEIDLTGLNGKSLIVERGDPAAYDWTLTNFIRDNLWHDLDCSGIVPAGAKFIILRGWFKHTLTSQQGWFRKKGYTNYLTGPTILTQGANLFFPATLLVACDENRVIQYNFVPTSSWLNIDMIVTQWIL